MLVLQAEVNKYGRLHSAELNEVAAECGRITSFSASLPPTGTTMKTQNCSAYSGGKNSAFSISLESSWQTRNTPLKLSSESMHPVVWAYVCVFFFFWGVSLEGFEWQSLHLMTEHRRPGAQRWSPRLHPQHVVSFFWSWPPRAAAPWWNNRVGRGGEEESDDTEQHLRKSAPGLCFILRPDETLRLLSSLPPLLSGGEHFKPSSTKL